MVKEMSIQCWSEEHYLYTMAVALPGISIWCIIVPLGLIYSLKKSHLHLDKINEKLKYGFLYKGYKGNRFYWEFLIYFRKLGIISCAVFLSIYSTYVQALSTFIFIVFGFMTQLKYKPYNHDQLNQMEIRSIIVSAVTIYAGLFFMTDDLNELWKMLLFIVMIISNVSFLYYWAYYTVGFYLGTICIRLNCFKGRSNWIKKVVPQLSESKTDVNTATIELTSPKGTKLVLPTSAGVSIDIKKNANQSKPKHLKLKWVKEIK